MKAKRAPLPLLAAFLTVLAFSSLSGAQSIMVEKNLFSPDRRPPSSESVLEGPTNDAGLPAKSVQLDGVFIHGDVKKALLRVRRNLVGNAGNSKDPFPYLTVREGESIGDFEVVRIDFRSVILAKGGQEYTVNIFSEGKVVPPAQPAPPPPAVELPPPPGEQPQQASEPQKGKQPEQAQPQPSPPASEGPAGERPPPEQGAQNNTNADVRRMPGNLVPGGTAGVAPPDEERVPPADGGGAEDATERQ